MSDMVALSAIRADQRAQPRTAINTVLIEEYTEAMANGAEFPPIVVFFDGEAYWVADGFHRYFASVGLGLADVRCDVRQGTVRDAILYSCGANAAHGQRRTNEDKRRAVLRMLEDAEWSAWSDREIARRCAVDHKTVSALRPKPADTGEVPQYAERTFVHPKTGQPTTMNTSRIGSNPPPRREWSPADIFTEDDDSEPATPRPVMAPAPRADDPTYAHISAALWEIDRQIRSLPAPTLAIERFPARHHHTLSASRLREWADWFHRAADAWDEIIGDRNVAAE